MKLLRVLLGGVVVLAIGAWTGHADGGKVEPLVVPVSKLVRRSVTDFADFTGRANAKNAVTIQPRVTGYLVKIAFKEGAEVKAGDLLFQIDPRPYHAQVSAARAKVAQAEAVLKYARATIARFKEIAKKQPDAVSAQELDQYQAQEEQAAAGLQFDRAHLDAAQLDLDWTFVRAPITGRIARSNVTLGNLVKQDVTKLTTLVSTDPMHVYFEVDERTLVRIRKAGKERAPAEMAVLLGLASEEGYPRRGIVDFVDNQVNPKTGGVSMRAIIANPKDGPSPLLPGMAVRVRLPIGQPYQVLLVSDQALVYDPAITFGPRKCVWVVDAENKVALRRLTLGQLQPDGLCVVENGLKTDDTIAVGILQRLRQGMKIQPELMAMPMFVPE